MSRVLICGGNGKVSKLLIPLLRDRYTVTAMIRDPSQSPAIESLGASVLVKSLETLSVDEMRGVVHDQDVIIWSAGAGGKGGEERTRAVDRDAASRMISASSSSSSPSSLERRKRFIMVSALTCRDPDDIASWWIDSDVKKFKTGYSAIRVYHESKVAADKVLMKSNTKWTIVRPGSLTDESATGKINAGKIHLDAKITRGDVAQVIYECLCDDGTVGLNIDILNGDTPVHEAIDGVVQRKESTL